MNPNTIRSTSIVQPSRLFSREEVLYRPSPVPKSWGVYGWFFRNAADFAPVGGCVALDDLHLLYIGISPDKQGKPNSKQNLRTRITNHYRGNAEGSTLRRSLGILLTGKSDFPLRRVGSGKRMTLTHLGEQWLDAWMQENAFVCWIEHQLPWELEHELLGTLSLPLNIKDNSHHSFSAKLKQMRREAIREAREMPIANEGNQRRTAT